MKTSTVITLSRDVISMCLGTFGIIHQELTGHVSLPLLGAYLVLLGVPAAAGIMKLLLPSDETEREQEHYHRHTRR